MSGLETDREGSATDILLVDDDNDLRMLVGEVLAGAGFKVSLAASGAELRSRLASSPVGLIVLDLNLHHEDGLSLCRELRASDSTVPIIMLTARADPIDRVLGLEFGADDYITKPFEPRELVARIRTVLRRATARPLSPAPKRASQAVFGGWTLDFDHRHLIASDGMLVLLSGLEYALLRAMVDSAQQVLSRETLQSVSNSRDHSGRAIDLQICRLRHKLLDETRASPLIKTVRGEGYVLAAPVEFH
jgi:two-component system OmpR family response regulator